MSLVFRWLIRIFITLCLVGIFAAGVLWYFLTRSIPDYDQDYLVAGISAPVEIVRNNHNVPHIFGSNDLDVFYGLGFAHAQDRLWQMTLTRRTAQGRLSELFGEETAEVDEFIRRLDLYRLSQASLEYQDREALEALEAYSAGVNAWIKRVSEEALGRGAPEFFLFKPEIAPWTPTDSLAIARLMNLQLSGAFAYELLRARTTLVVGDDLIQDIMPEAAGSGGVAMEQFAQLFKDGAIAPMTQVAQAHPLDPIKHYKKMGASNAFAANALHAARRAPLLSADTHLGLSAPSMFMLARLELEGAGIIGATIPGLPFVLQGRTDQFAWGFTSAYNDDVDVYIEQLNPNDPNQYLAPDGFKDFRSRKVIMGVKDQAPETLTLEWTDNGPVIPGHLFDLDNITPIGHKISLAWTALRENDRSVSAGLRLMKAQSIQDARQIMRDFHGPALNLVMADKNGVAIQMIGRMPQRDPAHGSRGVLPTQGWLERNRWKEDFDYSENPSSLNPASGYVLNSNNKLTEKPFPKHVSINWGDDQRINRLVKLLNERDIHSRDSFRTIQLDSVSYSARLLLPLVGKELWYTGGPAAAGTPEALRAKALELLAQWNGEMDQHTPEPLIYAEWMRQLQHLLIIDELGVLADEFWTLEPTFIERVFRDIEGAASWCDIRTSSLEETCQDIASKALDQAMLNLVDTYGDRIDSWRWGQAHQAHHDHQILGKIPLVNWVVNIRQDTAGGDNTLQRGQSKGRGATPFANTHASVYRVLVDFADPEASLFIISTGQSGHFLSRHYDDLAQLWRRGEYIPMTLDPELARSGAIGISTIRPMP